MTKKVIVTGADGQLGSKLQEKIKQRICQNSAISGWWFLPHREFDITDSESMEIAIRKYSPDIIVNCAAYTNVNEAETDELSAFEVNAYGPRKLAEICKEKDIFLIHISTDFVFSGCDINKPIPVDYKRAPLNVYGNSKNWGDFYIEQSGCKYIIIRTSWLYGDGSTQKNFVKSIADKLVSPQNCSDISVVISEVGSPTYTEDLAEFIMLITELDYKNKQGVYHYCNNGAISRYDFAKGIQEILQTIGVIDGGGNDVVPTFSFDKKVKRPSYSVLDNTKVQEVFGITIPYWKCSLSHALIRLMRNEGVIQ